MKFRNHQEMKKFIADQVENYDLNCYDVSESELIERMEENLKYLMLQREIDWNEEFELSDDDMQKLEEI